MDSFDFEMAGLFCQRALEVESTNLQALDMLGHICSELGDTSKAKGISFMQVSFSHVHVSNPVILLKHYYIFEGWASLTSYLQAFLHAVELSPDVGHSKYMYLGQIHTGQEAVDFYTKGIQVLLSALEKQAQTTVSVPQ